MSFAVHKLITFRGTLGDAGTGADMWQCGLRFVAVGAGGDGNSVAPANLVKCFDAFKAMLGSTSALFNGAVTLTETRGVQIGTNGKAAGLTSVYAPTSTGVGTSQANLHPWSTAIVLTLDAGGARGGRFGRIYLPPPAVAVQMNGRISSANRSNYATAAKTMINACQGATTDGQDLDLIVASARFGTNRSVTAVRVGDVLDTQRRRDNRLTEAYTTLTL